MATEARAKHRPFHEALRERSERQWIHACVLKRRVPWCDAEDVAQEVALEMSTAEAHLVVPEGQHWEEAWRVLLWRTVRRHTSAYWRRCARGRALSAELSNVEAAVPSAEDLMLANTRSVLLRAALAELKHAAPHLHAVLVARVLDEVSMAAIAAFLKTRLTTAWNRLRLARVALVDIVRRLAAQERGDATRRALRGGG